MEYAIEQIYRILGLHFHKKQYKRTISHLLTDSRNLFQPEHTLFVALVTPHGDGHQFISELYQKGVSVFLVSRIPEGDFGNADFIHVPDTLVALQKLAAAWRMQFSIPVIGITGSNGKTIVKEWLFQLLAEDYHITRSPKSFNSQTGVPLSVAEINDSHQLAIFEAGISQPGEMNKLEKIIRPDVGIFTNIGEAHAEGFTDIRQKIREKLQLFQHTKLLIYRKDNTDLETEILHFSHECHAKGTDTDLFSWTTHPEKEARLKVISIQQKRNTAGIIISVLQAIYKQKEISVEIPFTDAGSIENAIHCWCILLYFNINNAVIAERIKQLQPVAMRLEMKPGIQDCTIINDSYNSDFASIKVALDFLAHQRQYNTHTLILSDLEQSGEDETTLYKKMAGLLKEKQINRFIGIGEALCRQKKQFQDINQVAFYPSTESFLATVQKQPGKNIPFHNEIILLKGARKFAFEKISKLLEQKKHQNELEINLNAVAHNLKTYQALLKPGVKTMVMVKAFSYGSGSAEIASLLQFHRTDYLAVANIDEGIDLRKNGITLPILILNADPFYFDELIQWKLEPELYSISILKTFYDKIARMGLMDYPVHLKLDTGMHRLGFSEDEIPALLSFLKKQQALKIISIFSHLAASENQEMDDFTRQQGALFEKMSSKIIEALSYPVLRHLANTSGISRHPDLQFDMVRLGIGLYGIDAAIQDKLQVVHTLRTTISQIKNVPAGETIGYGRAGKAETDKRIAIAPIGYADGLLRYLGLGKAKMLLHDKRVSTIGNICMDMLMLDITEVPEAKEGDSVIVFGEKPRIEELAVQAGTIPYEILTGLSQRIIRLYMQE